MTRVTIITTEGCRHCQEAKKILDKLKSEYEFKVEEIDAESSKGQELIQKHKIFSSPGILFDDKFFSMGGVTEEQLRDKFEQQKKN